MNIRVSTLRGTLLLALATVVALSSVYVAYLEKFNSPVPAVYAQSDETSNVTGWLWNADDLGGSGANGGSGWTSLSCENDNECATSDYGVEVDASGDLSGHGWNGNGFGWLSFNRNETGNPPTNDIGNGSGAIARITGGNLVGWARFLTHGQGWSGWVQFTHVDYTVDTVNDRGILSGYAWNSDGDNGLGWFEFFADVVVKPPCCNPGDDLEAELRVNSDGDLETTIIEGTPRFDYAYICDSESNPGKNNIGWVTNTTNTNFTTDTYGGCDYSTPGTYKAWVKVENDDGDFDITSKTIDTNNPAAINGLRCYAKADAYNDSPDLGVTELKDIHDVLVGSKVTWYAEANSTSNITYDWMGGNANDPLSVVDDTQSSPSPSPNHETEVEVTYETVGIKTGSVTGTAGASIVPVTCDPENGFRVIVNPDFEEN